MRGIFGLYIIGVRRNEVTLTFKLKRRKFKYL